MLGTSGTDNSEYQTMLGTSGTDNSEYQTMLGTSGTDNSEYQKMLGTSGTDNSEYQTMPSIRYNQTVSVSQWYKTGMECLSFVPCDLNYGVELKMIAW